MPPSFKTSKTLEVRLQESQSVRSRHPTRVPVIVERADAKVPEIDKTKFLVPNDLTVGQFSYVIRKRLKLDAEKAMFLMTESGSMPPTGAMMSTVYQEHKDVDGFLYIVYAGENAFG